MKPSEVIYNIGDRVIVKEYADIPVESRTKGIARLSGKIGTITDKLYSECFDGFVYNIKFDEFELPSKKLWTDDCFTYHNEPTTTYCYEFDFLNDMVVAKFYEVKGDTKTEIERGHGHIIHDGAKGIAQASSYALKKIFEKMNGGKIE